MALTTKDFSTIVSDMVTAIQGAAAVLVDLTIGSILRATVEANAAVVLWLQGLILQLLATTRAATSNATDLDSWVGDYGLTRLPAVAATGVVTFARFTPTLQAIIPVGALVQTADGTQQYTVMADATQTAYNAGLNAYVIAAGVTSCTATVQAVNAAAATNAAAGVINTLVQAISGVDTVTNALNFTNGADAESDGALRARFVTYVASLAKATKAAIGFAITSVQQGVDYVITENLSYGGTPTNDYFYVVVDDGTGTPSSSFLTAVSNAIDLVRPITSTFGVYAPVLVTANVAMTVTVGAGYTHGTVATTVQAALQAYINALTIGQPLTYSRLMQVAYDASPGVVDVTLVTLNGGTADLAATSQQVIKSGTIVIS